MLGRRINTGIVLLACICGILLLLLVTRNVSVTRHTDSQVKEVELGMLREQVFRDVSLWIQQELIRQNASPSTRGKDACASGYLENFPPICGADGCLPHLTVRGRSSEVPAMPDDTRKRILATGGMMGGANIDIVWYFTQAQREFGVYGSVGEIGVYWGRYSSAMAYWLDTEAGERLFACDLFSGKEFAHLKTIKGSRKDKYEETMSYLNLSFTHKDEARRIRLFQDTSVHLSKSTMLQMALPAFRLFSIDGGHVHPVPLLDLLFTSCVVTEGAVISLDDTHSPFHPHVAQALEQFYTNFGTNIWRPIMCQSLTNCTWYKPAGTTSTWVGLTNMKCSKSLKM